MLNDKGADGKDLVFIVGPARSGTKLLQGILNQAPELSIGPESHIFPKLLTRFSGKVPSDHQKEISRILERSNYFLKLKRNGFVADPQEYIENARSIGELVERSIREVALWQKPSARLFGDKTPTYASYIELLKEHFPKARFVAILRDPRDRSLSVASSWGKSPLLAAHEWQRPARSILQAKEKWGDELLLLHYETLLKDPERTVQTACAFLGISYDPKMLEADSSEKSGTVKGMKGVFHGNTEKFWDKMSEGRIRRIEQLVYEELRRSGYPVHIASHYRPMGTIHLLLLRIKDFIKNIWFHLRERGIIRGFRYMMSLRRDKLK